MIDKDVDRKLHYRFKMFSAAQLEAVLAKNVLRATRGEATIKIEIWIGPIWTSEKRTVRLPTLDFIKWLAARLEEMKHDQRRAEEGAGL
jgi:hypothetical protein